MPAFDPVRDAVLNSPVAQTKSLPFRLELPPHTMPNPSPTSSSADSAVSAPSPATRRATHLSMLLNDEPPPSADPASQSLFTPTTPRGPNALSHLLHHDQSPTSINEQLAHATPLRRRSDSISGSYFPPTTPSPLAFPSRSQDRPSVPSSPAADIAFPAPSQPSQPLPSPALALPGLSSAPRPDPSKDLSARRRLSNASDPWPHREQSASYFPPQQTRSPAVHAQDIHRPSLSPSTRSPLTRSPSTPFAHLPVSSYQQAPPSPTDSIFSRPSTSGSSSAPRPVSPAAVKRPANKPSTSSAMPPPPLPAPTHSLPPSLPPKPQTTVSPKLPLPPPLPAHPVALTHSRSKIPYAPTKRFSQPASVLIPLSPAEMDRYRNFTGGVGTQMLKQRKRKRENDPADESEAWPNKRTRDVGLIAGHYNARPEVGVVQRQDSPIFGLKSFNNWVKSVLITSQAHPVVSRSPYAGPLVQAPGRANQGMRPPRGSGKVLDIGCGKGGDLIKWVKARIREYVGVDIAAVSIEQARKRYTELKYPKFSAYFTAADCYQQSLGKALPPSILPPEAPEFDVVSMQFCMHYAFETEEKARTMLANVSTWLRPGGVFIGTVPNSSWLLDHLKTVPKDASELVFGNAVYQIRFDDRKNRPLYGDRYWFYLKDAVEDVPEYVVHWDNFVQLAAEYDLHLNYVKEFHEVFSDNHEHRDFGPLLQHMKVVDPNGESQMDEDQWEAANIYLAFAFEKR